MRRKRLWLALLLLLILVLSLPFVSNLEVFRKQVHRALERQLGRPVEFASLTARLLPRPGVVARGVVVYEQPGFGEEPFLYADEVHCDLAGRVLWTGRLEFSRIHFVRPSINLVRTPQQDWNVSRLLRTGAPPPAAAPPIISASEGRINFKFGPDKQVYVLSDVQLWLEPTPDAGWHFAVRATPMRVDLRLTETGELRFQGDVGRSPDFASLPITLEATLDEGSLAQWWTLFTGREPLWRATASLSLTLTGTPSDWQAQGVVALANLHRWDLVAPPGSPRWRLNFKLHLDRPQSELRIEEATLRGDRFELQVTGQVHDPFGQPQWSLEATTGRLVLDELRAQWAGLKAGVAPDLRWNGVAQLGLSAGGPLASWKGLLALPAGAGLHIPGLPRPVELSDLRVKWENGRVVLEPLVLQFSPANNLTLSGELRLDQPGLPYRLRWDSPNMEMEPLWRTAQAFGWDLFDSAHWGGQATVGLEWRGEALSGEAPRWQGQVALREAKFQPPEFNQPLRILDARLAWTGTQVQVKPLVVRLGDSNVTGTLERPNPQAPWTLSLAAPRLRLGDMNELLNPGRRSLLARLVRPESTRTPPWLDWNLTGDLRVDELVAGPLHLRGVEAQGEWKAGQLECKRLRFRAYDGRFDGRFQADFGAALPQYRLAGNIKQLNLAGLLTDSSALAGQFTGLLSADVALQTAGSRPRDLRHNLQGRVVGGLNHGTITNLNLLAALAAAAGSDSSELAADAPTQMQSLSGDFRLAEERVELDRAQLVTENAAFELSGEVGFDAGLDLRLSGQPLRVSGREPSPLTTRLLSSPYRLTGTLSQPEVRLAEPLPAAAPR